MLDTTVFSVNQLWTVATARWRSDIPTCTGLFLEGQRQDGTELLVRTTRLLPSEKTRGGDILENTSEGHTKRYSNIEEFRFDERAWQTVALTNQQPVCIHCAFKLIHKAAVTDKPFSRRLLRPISMVWDRTSMVRCGAASCCDTPSLDLTGSGWSCLGIAGTDGTVAINANIYSPSFDDCWVQVFKERWYWYRKTCLETTVDFS